MRKVGTERIFVRIGLAGFTPRLKRPKPCGIWVFTYAEQKQIYCSTTMRTLRLLQLDTSVERAGQLSQ